MYKFFIALCSLGLLSLSANTQAADWKPIIEGTNVKVYVDLDSISHDNYTDSYARIMHNDESLYTIVHIWTKFVYNTPQKANNGKLYKEMKQKQSYYCKKKSYSVGTAYSYNGKQELVETLSPPYRVANLYSGDIEIIPDTIAEGLYKSLCYPFN